MIQYTSFHLKHIASIQKQILLGYLYFITTEIVFLKHYFNSEKLIKCLVKTPKACKLDI